VNVSLVGPEINAHDPAGVYLLKLAQSLAQRGARVQLYVPGVSTDLPEDVAPGVIVIGNEDLRALETSDFLEADACLFYLPGSEPWLPASKQIKPAVIILDCHAAPRDEDSRWLYYADLCIAATPEIRRALVRTHGCAPDRVVMLPLADQQRWDELARIVAQAAAGTLDHAEIEEKKEGNASLPVSAAASPGPSSPAALKAMLELVRDRADVALRGYVVRSRLPLVAWLRRNLTSHLREPYLDPIIERQVAFNQDVLTWMEQSLERIDRLDARLSRLEALLESGRRRESDSPDQDNISQETVT
jgi:hypothetical protein